MCLSLLPNTILTFTAIGRHPYIHLIFHTTELLRADGLAQGPSSRSLAVLAFELTTFRSVVQCLNILMISTTEIITRTTR